MRRWGIAGVFLLLLLPISLLSFPPAFASPPLWRSDFDDLSGWDIASSSGAWSVSGGWLRQENLAGDAMLVSNSSLTFSDLSLLLLFRPISGPNTSSLRLWLRYRNGQGYALELSSYKCALIKRNNSDFELASINWYRINYNYSYQIAFEAKNSSLKAAINGTQIFMAVDAVGWHEGLIGIETRRLRAAFDFIQITSFSASRYLLSIRAFDASSGAAIPSASISIRDQSGTVVASGSTNASGIFSISLPSSLYYINASATGHAPATGTVFLGSDFTLTLLLQPTAPPPPPLPSGYSVAFARTELAIVKINGNPINGIRWELISESPLMVQVYYHTADQLRAPLSIRLIRPREAALDPSGKYKIQVVQIADDGRGIFVFSPLEGELSVALTVWGATPTEYGEPRNIHNVTVAASKGALYAITFQGQTEPFCAFDWILVTTQNQTLPQIRIYNKAGQIAKTGLATSTSRPAATFGGFDGVAIMFLQRIREDLCVWLVYANNPFAVKQFDGFAPKPLPSIALGRKEYSTGEYVVVNFKLPAGTTNVTAKISPFDYSDAKITWNPSTLEGVLTFKAQNNIGYSATVTALTPMGKYESSISIPISPPIWSNPVLWFIIAVFSLLTIMMVLFIRARRPIKVSVNEVLGAI